VSWAGLVDAAVLGTGRAPRVAGTWAPLDETGLDDTDDQTRLLHYAAALSRARRAGFRPPLCSERPAPAPAAPDGGPPVSFAAQRRLGDLLAAGQYDLVAEWLAHLAGRRPPDVLLPDLLTAAAGHPRLRASLSPALGPLAGWLAGFNEECVGARDRTAAGRPVARLGDRQRRRTASAARPAAGGRPGHGPRPGRVDLGRRPAP